MALASGFRERLSGCTNVASSKRRLGIKTTRPEGKRSIVFLVARSHTARRTLDRVRADIAKAAAGSEVFKALVLHIFAFVF